MRPLAHVPPRLLPFADELAALPVSPLLVRCTVPSGYLPAEPDGALHLDSLLSWAVLQSFAQPVWFPPGGAVIPIPLARLWVSPVGLPLWATSTLRPSNTAARWQGHWHKRYPTDRAEWGKRTAANLSSGRWKEYRVPVTTWHAGELVACCIGHQASITALLTQVTHVGKKGAAGYGRVGAWTVAPWEAPITETAEAILASRPVPVQALGELARPFAPAAVKVAGWTPPYWFRPWHEAVVTP